MANRGSVAQAIACCVILMRRIRIRKKIPTVDVLRRDGCRVRSDRDFFLRGLLISGKACDKVRYRGILARPSYPLRRLLSRLSHLHVTGIYQGRGGASKNVNGIGSAHSGMMPVSAGSNDNALRCCFYSTKSSTVCFYPDWSCCSN